VLLAGDVVSGPPRPLLGAKLPTVGRSSLDAGALAYLRAKGWIAEELKNKAA
jgi:hypothetical protein